MVLQSEYQGKWWISDDPKNEFLGILRINESNLATLEIKSPLGHGFRRNSPIILGLTTVPDHKTISLHRSFSPGPTEYIIEKVQKETFKAWTTVVGLHVNSHEELTFKKVFVEFDNLEKWVYPEVFLEGSMPENDSFLIKLSKKVPVLRPAEADGFKISIKPAELSYKGEEDKATILKSTYFEIMALEDERPLSDFNRIISSVQNFLTFIFTKAVRIKAIWGNSEKAAYMSESGEKYYDRIDILQYGVFHYGPGEEVYTSEMLFRFDYVADKIDRLLETWINKTESLGPVFTLYFATIHARQIFVENQFLDLVQAVESYHRRVFKGEKAEYLDDTTYREGLYKHFVTAIPDDLSENFRRSLKARMYYMNQFSLRKRLEVLLKNSPEVLQKEIRDADKFINEVKETRNYLIHLDPKKDAKADIKIGANELGILSVYLRLVLTAYFLRELDFTDNQINDILSKHINYQLPLRYRTYR